MMQVWYAVELDQIFIYDPVRELVHLPSYTVFNPEVALLVVPYSYEELKSSAILGIVTLVGIL